MKHKWTDADKQTLAQIYPDSTAQQVSAVLGVSLAGIYRMARLLGIEKSDEFKASAKSGRIQRGQKDERLKGSQFKPGHITWNKGKPGTTGLHPNCRKNQFKPGRPPHESHRYKPIGTLRINRDGYLERKVTDSPDIQPVRRWVGVHRLVWEAVHGPVAPGHIVVFKNRQRTNKLEEITIDRLECISRADNARRNTLHHRNPELARLAQLKGAINRQVNRIVRESQKT